MKQFLLLFTIAFTFILSTNGQSDTLNQENDQGEKIGYWIKTDTDGNKIYEGTFANDKPIGKLVRYYPSGTVQAIMNFQNDQVTSYTQLFLENGDLAGEGIFVNNRKNGDWKYYLNDSILLNTESYQNGVKHGKSISYYENKQVSEIINWNLGQKDGEWIKYYTNGAKKMETKYKNNILQGKFTSYTISGSIDVTGYYVNDKMHGIWKYTDDKGKIIEVEYIHGVPKNKEEFERKEMEKLEELEKNKGKIMEPEDQLYNEPAPEEESKKSEKKKKKRR